MWCAEFLGGPGAQPYLVVVQLGVCCYSAEARAFECQLRRNVVKVSVGADQGHRVVRRDANQGDQCLGRVAVSARGGRQAIPDLDRAALVGATFEADTADSKIIRSSADPEIAERARIAVVLAGVKKAADRTEVTLEREIGHPQVRWPGFTIADTTRLGFVYGV